MCNVGLSPPVTTAAARTPPHTPSPTYSELPRLMRHGLRERLKDGLWATSIKRQSRSGCQRSLDTPAWPSAGYKWRNKQRLWVLMLYLCWIVARKWREDYSQAWSRGQRAARGILGWKTQEAGEWFRSWWRHMGGPRPRSHLHCWIMNGDRKWGWRGFWPFTPVIKRNTCKCFPVYFLGDTEGEITARLFFFFL